ncbi:MAG TPA: BamA/TamA family outer membrane protein [Nostocaceae cyanobacterium]|nr:BamA/TamA family outer membrane protein [Nostocaceae cyanobacterium]
MSKKRLSPVLVAAVGAGFPCLIAIPLGGSLSANAQTTEITEPTTEVATIETPQQTNPVVIPVEENTAFSPQTMVKSPLSAMAQRPQEAIAQRPQEAIATQVKPDSLQSEASTAFSPQTMAKSPPETLATQVKSDSQPPAVVIIPNSPTSLTTTQTSQPTATTAVIIPNNPPAEKPLGADALKIAQAPEAPNPESPENTTSPPEQPEQPAEQPTTPIAPQTNEPRVLVSEVLVRASSGELASELEDQIYRVIRTQAGQTTTRSQLQEDINAIFGTGFFSNVQALPEDTPLGVRVSFVVDPNPVLTKVEIEANPGTGVASVLPPNTVEEVFRDQYGKILNLRDLQEGIKQLTKRYQDQGYVLANLIGAPRVSANGVATLVVAEGVVENIKVRFRDKEGQATDEKGEPIRGRTQEYIITRELQLKPGQVFNRNIVQKDLQRVFGLGLFEDVNVSLDPGTDPSKVDVVVNVAERSSGSIAAGAGISSASGLFGTISYQQQNLNGRNQKLGAEVQVGERELLFDLRFTDPWIAGDPYRTSYTTNIFRRRSISLIFDGKDRDIETFDPNSPVTQEGDRPAITRLGGGVVFTRPLSANPYEPSEWTASAGLQYQRVSSRDADGNIRPLGSIYENGQAVGEKILLTQSPSGEDDLLLLQLNALRDQRNNPLQPTSGSFLRLGVDQSVPIGSGNILLTRLRGSYSQYIPVKFTGFSNKPETLAFNLQAGTVLGDLPPYEAFTLGGSNSVRGYEDGGLGTGRSYVQASLEYRFPVFSVISGALFFDYGNDLGTSTRAAQLLNKDGNGYGYGLGVRVQSPLGPIRIDYGINDDGDSRINFGIGERF